MFIRGWGIPGQYKHAENISIKVMLTFLISCSVMGRANLCVRIQEMTKIMVGAMVRMFTYDTLAGLIYVLKGLGHFERI